MTTNNEKGRSFALVIGAYIIIKAILNMIIGGGFNLSELLMGAAMFLMLYSGMTYLNLVVAVVLGLGVVGNLWTNLTNLPQNLIYLIEGIIDMGCIVLLVIQRDIREHFTNPWALKK